MESSDAFAFYEKLMKQELQMDKALVSQLFETIHYLYPKTAEQQAATKAVASKRDEVSIPGLAMQNTAPVQIEVNDKDANKQTNKQNVNGKPAGLFLPEGPAPFARTPLLSKRP